MARTVQEIQEEQNILAKKQAELKAAIADPDLQNKFPGQVARIQGQAALAALESRAAALKTELAQTTNQSASTGVYQGKDPVTGLNVYTNPNTGATFKSQDGPTDAQQAAFEKTQTPASSPPPQTSATDPAAPNPLVPPASIPVNIITPTIDSNTELFPVTTVEAVPSGGNAPRDVINEPNVAPIQDDQTVQDARTVTQSPYRGAGAAPDPQPVVQPNVSTDQDALLKTQQNIRDQILKTPVSPSGGGGASTTDTGSNTAGSVDAVRTAAVEQTQKNLRQQEDWRIRLQLAPKADYLYNTAVLGDILYPLKSTNGVVFPYTPAISVQYRANYDATDITHSNYKQYFYRNSSVEDITIQADFTAQDTMEALYLLSVIHFFKSVTKMFYGKDNKPRAGTPPPLCYLSGYGQYQFNNSPLLLTSFSYSLPNDVDYIRAGSTTQWAGTNLTYQSPKNTATSSSILDRLRNNKLNVGGISGEPDWNSLSNTSATYVPTKIQIQLSAVAVVTRGDIANTFSLEKYAKGDLLKKGIW